MKRRVLIYLTSMNLSGGKERVVSNLIKEWSTEFDLTLITKDSAESFYQLPDNINKISIKTVCLKRSYDMTKSKAVRMMNTLVNLISSVVALKQLLARLEYDYVYVTTPQNAFEMYYAMKNARTKLVVSEHASINAFNGVYSWMKKKVYPKAYCVSVPNSMDTEVYTTWGCNAVYMPHLVTFKATECNDLRSKVVLNVGRLTDDKQQDKLIEIWSNVKDRNGWELLIVGDGENKKKLENKIENLGLGNSVMLLPAQKDIESIYKKASLFAFTSRSEGFGMVLVEAMSFGVPCISFDCPSGPRDIIADGKNGYLIENGNIDDFIIKLERLLNMSNEDIDALGKGAFDTVRSWGNARILEQWRSVFS